MISSKDDMLQAFFDAGFYPHKVTHIELIQTHISWVFLTGDYAYKIKKPLNLGFLDFSSVEQRQQACRDELRLNQRLTDDIYLDVIPVSKSGEHLILGEGDRVIDYCLKMRQFDQQAIFDQLLSSSNFDPAYMDQLAVTLATFHNNTPPAPADTPFGDPSYLWKHIDASLEVARSHPETGFGERDVECLNRQCHHSYKRLIEKLEHRRKQGMIKDCHGDLHLKNIALIHGSPRPFDSIEFNDEFRVIDVLNDIAFLVMDCDIKNRADLGFRFLSRYLEQSGDYDGLILLPLYTAYRATVRGKVACLLSDDTGIGQQERQLQLDDAKHHFQLAAQYLKPVSVRLIAIGGLSGSGKSHLSLLACGIERAIIIRSDATRKRIFVHHPQYALYSTQMHELTYQTMFDDAQAALLAGFSVILDATFLHAPSRREVIRLATELNIPLTFLWLDIDHNILRERIIDRHKEGADISDADLHVLEMQIAEYQKPQEAEVQFISDSSQWSGTLTTKL